MQPLVSVIVPVYKVEKYLDRCVNSILKQTYNNFELILVDDGSPDKCPEMCDEYAKKDLRVKVIHKENGGLSDARNAGTAIAKGEYITFIDSDDWVLTDYIETLLDLLIAHDAQMSICSFQKVTKPDDTKENQGSKTKTYNKIEALENLLYQKPFDNSAWGKLYQADIAKKHLYPKGKLFEDLGTTYKMIEECERVVWTDTPLYCYFFNSDSITHQEFSVKRLDILELIDEQYDYICTTYPQIKKAASSRKFSAYCYAIKQLKNQNDKWDEVRNTLWNYIVSYRLAMLLDSKARMKNRIAAACTFLGMSVFCRI